MSFQAGSVAVRRGLFPDRRLASVQAGRVVSDDERGLALWVSAGSATMRRTDLEGKPTRHLPYVEEMQSATLCRPSSWQPYSSLMLTPHGAGHSVWWTFDAHHEFVGWYVNLETPSARWFGGTDHIDQALDILIDSEYRARWKDLEEFAEQCTHPELFWNEREAAAIRDHADHLASLAEQRRYPFNGTWCDFRPDPSWGPTGLPWWWDQPTAPRSSR